MLKNNYQILLLIFIILCTALVSKSFSFYSSSTLGEVFRLQMSEWKPAETEIKAIKDGNIYSFSEKINLENSQHKNHEFSISERQYLTFQYKISSDENDPGFDDPNFLVKINEQNIYLDKVENNFWKKGFINLAELQSINNNYKVEFVAQNTFDELNNSELEIKNVSTSVFLAKHNDLIKFSVSKEKAEIYVKYVVFENEIEIPRELVLSSPYELLITEHFQNNKIEYFSKDSFGNIEESKFATIFTDFSPPDKIDNFTCYSESNKDLNVVFTSPNESFSRSSAIYDFRTSSEQITESIDWNVLEKVEPINFKKYGDSSLPSKSGEQENILFKNLDIDKSFLAVKSVDFAGNGSEISPCIKK